MARLELNTHGPEEGAFAGGTSDALLQLGLMYCVGRDVDMDLIEAHKWFNLAALRGNEEAKRHREEIARDMSKIDVARAQKLAREWVAAQ
jgi:TPR repeat protein